MTLVCAMHRIFQSEEDDRVMEQGFDPEAEQKPLEQATAKTEKPNLLARLLELLPLKART